jgi:hypothetical protein
MNIEELTCTEDSPALFAQAVKLLSEEVHRYRHEPCESSALRVCRCTRRVWETVEGLLGTGYAIEEQLLNRAIDAIAAGRKAVSEARLASDTPAEAVVHIRDMAQAMAERRDELMILRDKGESAFLAHLLHRQLSTA